MGGALMSFLTERYFQLLEKHDIYESVVGLKSLQYFMERHIICVWSYTALLQSLHKDLVAMVFPLNSESHKEAIRLISEIIINEEVDDLGDGRYLSHLELYLEAMQDLDCDLSKILDFFDQLETNRSIDEAIKKSLFSEEIKEYARATARFLRKPLHIRAAALYYEGEPFFPDQFLYRLYLLSDHIKCDKALWYFEKHIEGIKCQDFSAAGRLVEVLCKVDHKFDYEAESTASAVMRNRINLWNKILRGITNNALFTDDAISLTSTRHLKLVR